MYATNYFETGVLNAMKGVTFAAPLQTYVGLYLNNPTETGTAGTEIAYTGYERKIISWGTPAAESGGIGIKNDIQITFNKADRDVGTVTYIGIHDSKVGGNMLAYGILTEPLVIAETDAPVLLVGEVIYYLTGDLSNAYKTKLLNIFRGQNLVGVSPHFALYNGNPENGGAELSGANYARVPLTFTAPKESESGQMSIENSVTTNFNRPTTSWGNWTYSAIFDRLTGGEPIWLQEKTPAKEIKKGYMPIIAEGNVRMAIN